MQFLNSILLVTSTTILVAGCNTVTSNQSESNHSSSKTTPVVTQQISTQTNQTQQVPTILPPPTIQPPKMQPPPKTQLPPTIQPPIIQPPTIPPPPKIQPSIIQPPTISPPPKMQPPTIPPPPTIKVPTIKTPTIKIPTIKIPEVSLPTIKVQANEKLMILTLPSDILFNFDKDNIRSDARQALTQVAQVVIKRYPQNHLQIQGYTDSVGSDSYNQNLSERRAKAVSQWLSENYKVAVGRMTTRGYGESQPLAPNTKADGTDNPSGRQQNRRVEVIIQKQ